MTENNRICLYTCPEIATAIRGYIKTNKLDKLYRLDIYDNENSDKTYLIYNNQKKTYILPLRIGEILDQVKYYNDQNSVIYFANSSCLNINDGTFINKNGEKVFLTEKEIDILSLLYSKKGQVISKIELLENIWKYSQEIETHTLETHIYRLRQKIEENPTTPQILITQNNGYMAL